MNIEVKENETLKNNDSIPKISSTATEHYKIRIQSLEDQIDVIKKVLQCKKLCDDTALRRQKEKQELLENINALKSVENVVRAQSEELCFWEEQNKLNRRCQVKETEKTYVETVEKYKHVRKEVNEYVGKEIAYLNQLNEILAKIDQVKIDIRSVQKESLEEINRVLKLNTDLKTIKQEKIN